MTTSRPSILREYWERGQTLHQFVDGMTEHQESMRRRLAAVNVPDGDRQAFAALRPGFHIAVITEDYCGDSLMNVPILVALAANATQVEMKFFARSNFPEIAADYASRGVTNIPIVAFLNADFEEIGLFVERPSGANQPVKQWIEDRVEFAQSISPDFPMTDEERRSLREKYVPQLLRDMEAWYEGPLKQQAIDELKAAAGVRSS